MGKKLAFSGSNVKKNCVGVDCARNRSIKNGDINARLEAKPFFIGDKSNLLIGVQNSRFKILYENI